MSMTDWLGTPYRELPPAKVLKKGSAGYIQGVSEGNWITWKSTQKLSDNMFKLEGWDNVAFGFEGTYNLLQKMKKELRTKTSTNLIRDLKKKDIPYYHANYWEALWPTLRYDKTTGFGAYAGGIICLLWQSGLGGDWVIATPYGISQGVEVSIRKGYEWRLRQGLKIGFMYFVPEGEMIRYHNDMSYRELLQGITYWNWEDVRIDLWGEAIQQKEHDGRSGIPLGDEIWTHIGEYGGYMKVGTYDAITDGAYSNERRLTDWIEDVVNSGRSVGIITPRGFRYFLVNSQDDMDKETYDDLYRKVRINDKK